MKQILLLPHKFPTLNELISAASANRFKYGKVKKDETQYVALQCCYQKIQPVTSSVKIEFTWQEANRRRDFDNICGAGQKFILDGLKLAGVIKDDRQSCVTGLKHTFVIGSTYNVTVEIAHDRETKGLELSVAA